MTKLFIEKPKKPVNPCTPDCPERSGECHGTCEKYDKYVKDNEVWNKYILSQKQPQSKGYVFDCRAKKTGQI